MSAADARRGGAPVGHMDALDPVRLASIRYLRMWCDPLCRAQVVQAFVSGLGHEDGQAAMSALDGVCSVCARRGRRSLMRHDVECACVGADEAWFANLVEAASAGVEDDALMIASYLVRPDTAPCLVGLAGTFGLAIRHLSRAAPVTGQTAPAPHTHRLH